MKHISAYEHYTQLKIEKDKGSFNCDAKYLNDY